MNALSPLRPVAVHSEHAEYQYLDLLRDLLENGVERSDRTGVGTKGLFGRQIRFDLADGFPLLTTKKLHLRSIVLELLWFLTGETNVQWLRDRNVTIWNEWACPITGDLGPVYGKQWRSWAAPNKSGEGTHPIDQIGNVIKEIRNNPSSRRLVVSAWNPADIEDMKLPPCHCLFQFFVADGKLSCQLYQRSADVFLGVPFNIASYALLTMMMAQVTGHEPGEFVHTFGDVHLYLNHVDQAREQLTREPYPFPTMTLAPKADLFAFEYPDDFMLEGYQAWPHIKAEVAV